MKHYYVYNNFTGQIERIGRSPHSQNRGANSTFSFVSNKVNPATHYHDTTTDTLTERPDLAPLISKTSILADGVDETVISSLPNPTTVTWPDGQVDTVTDGSIEFSVDLEGSYTFKLELFPYKSKEITVEAVTPA